MSVAGGEIWNWNMETWNFTSLCGFMYPFNFYTSAASQLHNRVTQSSSRIYFCRFSCLRLSSWWDISGKIISKRCLPLSRERSDGVKTGGRETLKGEEGWGRDE